MNKPDYVTDKTLRAWLRHGPVDRGIGGGLTFVASAAAAARGTGSWLLRYRFGTASKEKVLGRYPDLSLKDAREAARHDRALIQRGTDVAAVKRIARLEAQERHTVASLGKAWYERYILGRYADPSVVECVLRLHINPVIGKVPLREVRPSHVEKTLARIVKNGAPTVANDALRYLVRMFHYAMKKHWVTVNPAAGFELSDAGGTEKPRERWLALHELIALAKAMRNNDSFGGSRCIWSVSAATARRWPAVWPGWIRRCARSGTRTVCTSSPSTRIASAKPTSAASSTAERILGGTRHW